MLDSLLFNFSLSGAFLSQGLTVLFFVLFLLTMQIIKYRKNDQLIVLKWPAHLQISFILIIAYLNLYVMALGHNATIGGGTPFVYFQ